MPSDVLFTGFGCAHLPSPQSSQFYTYNLCNVPPHVPRRFMTRICQSALAVQETITSRRICWELVAQCCSSCSYFAMGATGFKNPRRQLWGKRCGVTSSPHFSQLRAPRRTDNIVNGAHLQACLHWKTHAASHKTLLCCALRRINYYWKNCLVIFDSLENSLLEV